MSDIQIIGVDISNSRDFTAILGTCGKCHTVFDIKLYDPNINQTNFPLYINCPACGTKIKRYVIA